MGAAVIGDNNGRDFRLERKKASQKRLWDVGGDDVPKASLLGCGF